MYHFYPFKQFYLVPVNGYYSVPQPYVLARPPTPRSYPAVNTALFKQSAQSTSQLLHEITLLLNKLTADNNFARQLMTAAQAANRKEVERLVRSAGVIRKADISFTPDFFRIELTAADANPSCCKLAVSLRWNQ